MRPLTKIRWMIRTVANCCKGSAEAGNPRTEENYETTKRIF